MLRALRQDGCLHIQNLFDYLQTNHQSTWRHGPEGSNHHHQCFEHLCPKTHNVKTICLGLKHRIRKTDEITQSLKIFS
jgi:hypothetical protein